MIQSHGTRVTTSAITFVHAFVLGEDTRKLPPGTYVAHTHEDEFRSSSGPIFVRTIVDFEVTEIGGRSIRQVRPKELDLALARDEALSRETQGG